MKKLYQCFKSEALLLSKTPFFLLHFMIPAIGVLIFSIYTKITSYPPQGLANGFFQVLALMYPIVAALICAIVLQPDVEAGNSYYLLSASSRNRVLLVKTIYMFSLGLLSCLLASVGYGAALRSICNTNISISLFLKAGILLWGCSLFLYLFHLWLHMEFGRNVSFAVSAVEILLSALLLTGLGDGIWYFIPSAWSIRLLSMGASVYLLDAGAEVMFSRQEFILGSLLTVLVTIIAFFLLFIWFSRWEGRKAEEA